MTNKESNTTVDYKPRKAALLALHLVSQILDEAYVIANAASDSGQPWQYLSMVKSINTDIFKMDNKEMSCEASKGDCDQNKNKAGIVGNVVATSTPQKLTRLSCSDDVEIPALHNDATLIGQGDEELGMHQSELDNSTSMLINNLFDMSDTERQVVCEDIEIKEGSLEINDLPSESKSKNNSVKPMIPDETFSLTPNVNIIDRSVPVELSRSDKSDYSFLADAQYDADITRDVAFYIEDQRNKRKNEELYEAVVTKDINEDTYSIQEIDENTQNKSKENEDTLYENAYVTLNRDYDQGSEDDGYPVLQDPKTMNLQEVELMTANTSEDNLSYPQPQENKKCNEAVPEGSGISISQKSSIVRRCRMKGARMLACIRGWWRRKTPGKRKESRGPITIGICPLSPDARRRASSLMDNRLLQSPSSSRHIVWKFNTVNEAIVSSNRWKDYTFDIRPDDY